MKYLFLPAIFFGILITIGFLLLLVSSLRSSLIIRIPLPDSTTQEVMVFESPQWEIRSIDTMKFSRDRARQMLTSAQARDQIAERMERIASTGANYVAIGTPYDEEFVPILTIWVEEARKQHLHVWFRGNFSGWENWFSYSRINRSQHTARLTDFIRKNPTLFADGDIFTSCPECENGGPGDPRRTGDVAGHRTFLINQKILMDSEFQKLGKKVKAGYFSMNYDVAKLVMDKQTTEQLGGIIVIDHYVTSAEQVATDALALAKATDGKVVLGEIGAPIPDLHGQMTEQEQAAWIDEAFKNLKTLAIIQGVNYWVDSDGTTALWQSNGRERQALSVVTRYYKKYE